MRRRTFMQAAGALAATVAMPALSRAQAAYPAKPVRIIVPYPAGAAGDILARFFAETTGPKLRYPILVENRAGGAGIAATETVARAEPDGHTLLLTGPNHVTNVGLYATLPYDPDKDFAMIGVLGTDYLLVMSNPASGITTAKELIARAKASPGTINYSSSGIGTGGHLAMELFQRMAGIKLNHVPYRGATPAMADTVAGHVPLNLTGYAPAIEFIRTGRLIPLVFASPDRFGPLPEVPIGKDIGLPDWVVGAWFGLSAPARTPQPVIDLLARHLDEAIKSELVSNRMKLTGTVPGSGGPQAFTALIRSELQRWPKIIREAGIKPQ
jgi:tripartite-type tricarboxylate transporter receptor subunit TctC